MEERFVMSVALREETLREVLRRRSGSRHSLAERIGEILFQFGMLGAIGWYVLGFSTLVENIHIASSAIDGFSYLILGGISYCTGWILRFFLTRMTGLL